MRRLLGVWLVAAMLVLAAGASARPAATNGRIGYLRPLGGNAPPWIHLFTIAPDGSGATDLTPAGYSDVRGFAWSPDGRRIAFSAAQDGDLDQEIFVMDADGTNVRRLTDNQFPDLEPTWSPDGRSLAFTSIRTGIAQVYRMRADGSGQRRLTNFVYGADEPAWSPRGGTIACRFKGVLEKIGLMRPDGTHIRVLLRRKNTDDSGPAWAPGGRLLAFSRGTHGNPWTGLGIWTIRPDGTHLHRVLADGGSPAFSPDGRWLAFVRNLNGNQELWKVRANGSALTQLTNTYGITEDEPRWQRAGT